MNIIEREYLTKWIQIALSKLKAAELQIKILYLQTAILEKNQNDESKIKL